MQQRDRSSESFYTFYKQIHKPSGIENSIYCNFTSCKFKVLVTSVATKLEVFKLREEFLDVTENELVENFEKLNSGYFKGVLEHIGTWSMFGKVLSISNVSRNNGQLDMLLLSFSGGNISVVEFDEEAFDIKTLSLHSFTDHMKNNINVQENDIHHIKVDPQNRCAAMVLTSKSIAILDFSCEASSLQSEYAEYHQDKKKKVWSHVINLKELLNTQKIIDVEFLHGYYKPTLLILYESPLTWTGRVMTRRDTCNIVALSLSTKNLSSTQTSFPIVWSLNNLPYDSLKVVAVPKPIGGVVLFCNTSIIFLNQSVPAYGVSLNGLSEKATYFPLHKQDEVCIQLNCAASAFVNSKQLLVCLKDGQTYMITLKTAGMRSVKGIMFKKLINSTLPSSVVSMDSGFVFIGSRLGDPELIKLFVSEQTADNNIREGNIIAIKTEDNKENIKDVETPLDSVNGMETSLKDDDIQLMYKECFSDMQDENTIYSPIICDKLVNIGPCVASELGAPFKLPYEFQHNQHHNLELVTMSGCGSQGALSVLNRTVKPQIVTSFNLPGCDDMWTVYARNKSKRKNNNNFHRYLMISFEGSTMVLNSESSEITTAENCDFIKNEPSVYVGNLKSGFILQVCQTTVVLLDGAKKVDQIDVNVESPIQLCSLQDPHAVLLTADGQVILMSVITDRETGLPYKLEAKTSNLILSPAITSISLYCDRSGMFSTYERAPGTSLNNSQDSEPSAMETEPANNSTNLSILDQEDEMLYSASTSDNVDSDHFRSGIESQNSQANTSYSYCSQADNNYWIVVIRNKLHLEIYDFESEQLQFAVPNLSYGKQLLIDCHANYTIPENAPSEDSKMDNCDILEATLAALDRDGKYPFLLVRQSSLILIYKVFKYEKPKSSVANKGLKIRFKKVHHNMLTRKPNSASEFYDPTMFRPCFRLFRDINSYSGVFLCGTYPYWIIMTGRGNLECHPMMVEGKVSSFATFNNAFIPHGFIYFTTEEFLRLAHLRKGVRYDTEWPLRKVPLKETPHFICYSVDHKVYSIVTSKSTKCDKLPYINVEDDRVYEDLEREDGFIYPNKQQFTLQLFNTEYWHSIPNTSYTLDDHEHVTCMKNVFLTSSQHNIQNNYIALGTAAVLGEDNPSRGRILVAEVIDVVPDPNQPSTKNRFKMLYKGGQRGPVSALCSVGGHLLTAIGQKVFIWKFDGQTLSGLAFVDTNSYITHATSFHNLVVIGDIQRSISLLRFQPEWKTLGAISHHGKPTEVYSVELLVHEDRVTFIVADENKNLSYYAYEPNNDDSDGGKKLIKCGDIHVGQIVQCMWRVGCIQVDKSTGVPNELFDKAQITMTGSLDGGIGMILPIKERLFKRFQMVTNLMYQTQSQFAGLNPRFFRTYKHDKTELMNPKRNVLDGDFLWKYHNLSKLAKEEILRKIQMPQSEIEDALMELYRCTNVF